MTGNPQQKPDTIQADNHLVCLGAGYCARALISHLKTITLDGPDWKFSATCRSATDAAQLALDGIHALRIEEGSRPGAGLAKTLGSATHVLLSAPPGQAGDPFLRLTRDALAANKGLRWLGYLSTTGVYGDREGGEVDEASDLRPTSRRSEWRAAAERDWLELFRAEGVPVHIFRLAGIYGPGRNPLRRLLEGAATRIIKPGHLFSRIHVVDIAAVLEASMHRPDPGAIYNVTDDLAAPQDEVVAYGAELLGIEPPPAVAFEDAGLSEMAQSFYRDCKRVSNRRVREELGVTLRYPTYREGLASLVAHERQQSVDGRE